MLNIDRIYKWLFIIGFILLIPSLNIIGFGDELITYSILTTAIADCIVNKAWRKYRMLLIFIAIMTGYLVYSLTYVHYNIPTSIFFGWILEMKPFIPLIIFTEAALEFDETEKRIISRIAMVNFGIMLLSLPMYSFARKFIFGHDATYGGVALATAIIYLYCNLDKEKGFTKRSLTIFWLIMATGLVSMRSKFYGEFIVSLFLMIFYRQQMTRHLKMSHIVVFSLFTVILLAAIWEKLNAYFLSGIDLSNFDMSKMDEIARMALYAMAPVVLMFHPVFGTGLASYCSVASAVPGYSGLYAEVGLNKVYGLSPTFHDFICDAYYPSLVQYGFVGIILFIYFWVKIYSYLRPLTRQISAYNRAQFITATIIFLSIFIEMTTGTLVFMAPGIMIVAILGMICGRGRKLMEENDSKKSSIPIASSPHKTRIQ